MDIKTDTSAKKIADESSDKLGEMVVIGYDNAGNFYYNSNILDGPNVLWLLKLAEKKLLEEGDV